jgi:hypothetical protein
MHPISDKELDNLFQQRFESAEFQPAGDVWRKIAASMNETKKVRKTFPVFWMAAAGVVIVLGAGFWFYRPVEVIRLQGTGDKMVQITPESPFADLGTGAAMLDPHQPEIKGFDFSTLAASEKKTFNAPEEVTLPERPADEGSLQDVVASVNTSRRNLQEAVKPNNGVTVPRYTGDQSQLDVTQPDMIANAEVAEDELVPEQEQNAPKRIRSVGSLVNFVISKVDRREDKIIEFKDGDEGSEVSGINLGVIKLKSRIK